MASKEVEAFPTLTPAKGQTVRFLLDESKDPKDKWSRRIEVQSSGEPDCIPFEVPPHWHGLHDEYWTIMEGRMLATVDGKEMELKAGDEPLCIPRYHVHGIKALKGVKAILSESSDPPGEFKQLFIQDMYQEQQKDPSFWLAMRAMYDGDTYPALGGPVILDRVFITVAGGLAKLFAPGKPFEKDTAAPKSVWNEFR